MKYNLPWPDVRHRNKVSSYYLSRGEVVAFSFVDSSLGERTGIMVLESQTSFLAAVNLYEEEGRIWTMDEIPEDIKLYEATPEEMDWGLRYFFEHEYAMQHEEGKNLVIAFVEQECPVIMRENGWLKAKFCMRVLARLPKWGYIGNNKTFIGEIWKEAVKGANEGVAFNAQRAELYCFLIAILMIAENDDERNHDYYIGKLFREWDHFVWMYAMVIGRLIGCDLKTFTSMVNMLDNKKRGPYIRLYLPLVEGNIDKICRYSTVEKRYKLENAIQKMKVTGERHEQANNLDDLYEILFPRHFRKMMSESLPASTIKEMKEELAKKDEQIDHWKKAAEDLTEQVNQLTEGMKRRVEESLSMEDVSSAILAMSLDIAKTVFSNLDFKLRKNEVWRNGRDLLLDKLEEKEMALNGASVGTNNGIVAGGNLNANFSFTNEQVKMLIEGLALSGEQSKKLLTLTADGNNNTR